jgi:hypothetical protein
MFSMKLNLIIESMRPAQWVKNGLIFMALIFSKSLFEPDAVLKSKRQIASGRPVKDILTDIPSL